MSLTHAKPMLLQGMIQGFGSHSELIMKGVDTVQLLGLIGKGKELETKKKFTHSDNVGEDPIELDINANDCPKGILSSQSIASFSSEMNPSKHKEVCGACCIVCMVLILIAIRHRRLLHQQKRRLMEVSP